MVVRLEVRRKLNQPAHWNQTMYCPRDKTNLIAKDIKHHQVNYCSSCKGLWLPGDIVPSLLSSSANGRIRNLQHTTGSPLSCPGQCATLLEMRINGIVMDVCPSCGGVWLDRGEIEAVVKKVTKLRNGKRPQADSVLFSVVDGVSWNLLDLVEALVDGIFDGI